MADTIQVQIMGIPFSLKAGDNPEYVEALGKYVDSLMGELQSNSPKLSQLQVAVLTCLNLADRLEQASSTERYLEQAETRLRRIIDDFDVE